MKRHLAFGDITAHLANYIPVITDNENTRGWGFLHLHHYTESETVIIKKGKKRKILMP